MYSANISFLTPVTSGDRVSFSQIKIIGVFAPTPNCPESYLHFAQTDQHLLYFENPSSNFPSHYAQLNYDLKFEVIRQTPWKVLFFEIKDELTPGKPIGIKFEKEVSHNTFETLEVFSCDSGLVFSWKQTLESKLNQRNFHILFKAKKQIGRGAFATVYLAERLQDNKMVAVKAFSKQRQYSGQLGKESLVNQITLMRKFNHPNIIKLEAVFETQNSIYVILENLEGRQLYERLKNVKIELIQNQIQSPSDICEIIRKILQGLKEMSQKRVIHRDLKPQNIMFRRQGSNDLSICDFGLATFADEEKYLFLRCGTPGFVAPEIINIKDMSTRSDPISDVFSAGLIFHYLLFGQSIFNGKKYQEILLENKACSFDFEKDMYKNLSFLSLDLLKKLLDVNQNTRISAKDALLHPYFDVDRFTQIVQNNDVNQMMDEKLEYASTVAGKNRSNVVRKFERINSSNRQCSKRKQMSNQNIYGQKQNKMEIPLVKKVSIMNSLQVPIRRSQRREAQKKVAYYQQMRF